MYPWCKGCWKEKKCNYKECDYPERKAEYLGERSFTAYWWRW